MPSYWGVYFASDDCDTTVEKVKELGGSVIVPPMDIAPERGCQRTLDIPTASRARGSRAFPAPMHLTPIACLTGSRLRHSLWAQPSGACVIRLGYLGARASLGSKSGRHSVRAGKRRTSASPRTEAAHPTAANNARGSVPAYRPNLAAARRPGKPQTSVSASIRPERTAARNAS